jgi:hypothetical protein
MKEDKTANNGRQSTTPKTKNSGIQTMMMMNFVRGTTRRQFSPLTVTDL